uniref:Uncharacterized protein n=1 Tax=Periphykon beckeri TaxID=2006982 RepID=A0A1Z1M2Y8_9FLOR|nr:hypothetical protein [Periphykon beckeri]ARW60386.1 hypothetical protein [Periphykon beckeri]
MNKNLRIFSDHIGGDWFLQENLYYIQENIQKKNKYKINFLTNRTISKNFQKYIKSVGSKLKSQHKYKNLLKIGYINRNLSYQEYIYIISNNLMIILIVIKNLNTKQYMSLKISSYIKLIDKKEV